MPLVIGVQSERVKLDRREEIFDAWTNTFLHDRGLPLTAENYTAGRDGFVHAYGIENVRDGHSRELYPTPDSLIWPLVLATPPNDDNVIYLYMDATMSWVEHLRPNILHVVFPPHHVLGHRGTHDSQGHDGSSQSGV